MKGALQQSGRMLSRMLPNDFRSALPPDDGSSPVAVSLPFRCQCGKLACVIHAPQTSARTVRCHCTRCRKFGATAFAAFLPVPFGNVPSSLLSSDVRYFEDTCSVAGAVERMYCGACRSTIGMRCTAQEGGAATVYLGLGCLHPDENLDPALARHWQRDCDCWAIEEAPAWWTVRPTGRGNGVRRRVLRGGCSCGRCTFEAPSGDEFQLQHCCECPLSIAST